MRRMSMAILSLLILFVAACASPPATQPPAAPGRATLFEGARLIIFNLGWWPLAGHVAIRSTATRGRGRDLSAA